MNWLIRMRSLRDYWYWSNSLGWMRLRENATVYTPGEYQMFNRLPLQAGAEWVKTKRQA